MKKNSGQIKAQLESDRVPSYSQMENVRDVLLEMRDSSDPAVVDFAKRMSEALARDCYCQICGRILKGETVLNCNRFSSLKAAQREYIDHGCPKGLGFCVDGEIRKFPWKSQFEEWLFTPAEGKEASNG